MRDVYDLVELAAYGHMKVFERELLNGSIVIEDCSRPSSRNSAFLQAVVRNDIELVSLLLKSGADPNRKAGDDLPLAVCAQNGFDSLARLLIRNGAVVNAKDSNQDSPLLTAVKKGHKEIVKVLLSAGGCVNDCRLLDAAVRRGDMDITRLLVEYGADPNLKEPYWGLTAYEVAIQVRGDMDLAAILSKGPLHQSISKSTHVSAIQKLSNDGMRR